MMKLSANARKDSWQISHVQLYYHRTNHLRGICFILLGCLILNREGPGSKTSAIKGNLNLKLESSAVLKEQEKNLSVPPLLADYRSRDCCRYWSLRHLL
ncbi:hypothetical protein QL285_028735 [Trifolium repens]|nr:hypothetical protein QL285_028735 [Trifolium repens]